MGSRPSAVGSRSGRPTTWLPGLAAMVTVLAVGGCGWQTAAEAKAAGTVTVSVNPSQLGAPLTAGFIGLSVEAGELTHGQFGAANLVAYLKTLGPSGVLRVGGNSSDHTFWTSTGETPPTWSTGTITPASLRALATVATSSGWKVILGVNLKHKDPARAADEAAHAQQTLGPALEAIEIGNEPNYYYTSTSTYFTDFESYVTAIRKAAPGVGLVGPDPGHNHAAFLAAFASNEAAHPDVTEVTNHHYPLSACGGHATTIAELLSTSSVSNETAAATAVVNAGRKLHVPAAMTETNSVTCGGTAGVSDVYAAALWGLDYSLLLASNGVTSADFHGSVSGCGPYSPLCTSAGGTGLTARPVFYGMLASTLAGTGTFVTVTNPAAATIRAYAIKNGAGLTVVLDNVQDPAHAAATTISINLGQAFHQGQKVVLATSAGSGLSATTGITLGGHPINPDGTFPAPTRTPVQVSGQTATVPINAGSAAIIHFDTGMR